MIKQIDNRLWFYINGASRALIANYGRLWGGFYPLVNEYPKSGGSWFAQMLSDALDLPFPRNRLPMLRNSMLHGHYNYNSNLGNCCVVWRDGRDVMVSWYYHKIIGNELSSGKASSSLVKYLGFKDPVDINNNLPAFIEYSFEEQRQPKFSWADFVNAWSGKEAFHTKYELLLEDPGWELIKAVEWLGCSPLPQSHVNEIVSRYSFANLSGRKPGEESRKSYLRKGTSGDWKNHFSFQSRSLFNEYAGPKLVQLGYERDESWVKES